MMDSCDGRKSQIQFIGQYVLIAETHKQTRIKSPNKTMEVLRRLFKLYILQCRIMFSFPLLVNFDVATDVIIVFFAINILNLRTIRQICLTRWNLFGADETSSYHLDL